MRKSKPNRRDGDEMELELEVKPFYVSSIEGENKTRLYNIFIFKPIEDVEQFIPAIEALQVAGPDDVVLIHLSTPGGDIDATDTFLQALKCASARVIFVASGGVHSAGTLMLMHAEEVVLSDGFNALVHNGSVGFGAKYSDWVAATAHAKDRMEVLFRESYQGFLSEKEIEDLIAGKDFWFNREEFHERLQKRNKLFEDQEEHA